MASTALAGSQQLTDVSGLVFEITENQSNLMPDVESSGAALDATYTGMVSVTTVMGGSAMATLDDAFDGYNAVRVNGQRYNNNGAGTFECGGRLLRYNAQTVSADLSVSRTVFVPSNDEFIRFNTHITNNGTIAIPVTVDVLGDLGSDMTTVLVNTSSGDATVTTADLWATSMQDYNTQGMGGLSPDPRLGHVFGGANAPTSLSAIDFVAGDDTPTWSYTFVLSPGRTAIIVNFATGQPNKADAMTKAAELAMFMGNARQCMSAGELSAVMNFFVDTDGDGTADPLDACPNDPNKAADAGQCGCGTADTDGDGDGSADCVDGCPADPNKVAPGTCGCGTADTDSDGDGTADCNDGCPNDANKIAPGDCGCGVADADSDGDGALDCNETCDSDPNKTAPGVCGCGQLDVDSDGDGTLDCNDGCPNDGNKIAAGTCGCGTADTDSDGDGTPDCNDGCPSDADKTAAGDCGCGAAETDTDGDGAADCIDLCPNDPDKTAPGTCGCGLSDADADGDGVGDACEQATGACGIGACGAGIASFAPLALACCGLMRPRRRRL